MAKEKLDGIVEAAHYTADGQVAWVRVYERRGPTFSDLVIIQREELIRRIKGGKKYVAGSRKEYLSSTFEVKSPLLVIRAEDKDYLAFSAEAQAGDELPGLPVI
jgi:hypothetical protein